ncbi:MAG: ABC transporter ATP-binding protein [Chloroflexi bacterium]|nr:ABC transporter ATP-binding protein [Chloroflexota bacterium]
MTTIDARAVVAGYPGREVLHGIDLALRGGERVGLVGPNGSGKTTLLRSLAGILRTWSGAVELDGTPVGELAPRDRARRIAVVPQTFQTPFAFTAREIAGLGRTPYVGAFGQPSAEDRAAVAQALQMTGCEEIADRRLSELSGGERQRAVIAMALAQEADVLLLDEPTVHLDPHHQRAALDLVGRLARERGILVVAVLHDLNLAAALCDRVVVMAAGRIVADGGPAQALDAATVGAVFGTGLEVGSRDGITFVLPAR